MLRSGQPHPLHPILTHSIQQPEATGCHNFTDSQQRISQYSPRNIA